MSSPNNKKVGNDFETQLCEILFENGFWAHNMAQNQTGQPADVIAARNGNTYLIDCKVCKTKRGFALSRVEDNQDLSMDLWKKTGNGLGWFAILLNEEIYMIDHQMIKQIRTNMSYMNEEVIEFYGIPLERWLGK